LPWFTFATVFAALLTLGAAASADPIQQDDPNSESAQRARSLYRTVMSPFCPGRTLDSCPSPNATAWRSDIRKWVEEGVSTEEIRSRLQKRAEEDLSGGPNTGVGMWFAVAVASLAVVLLIVALRRLSAPAKIASNPPPEPPAPGSPDDAALDAKLDEELSDK
jgi:cytochrome c-type biogenesis protein CcmH/NrfF